MVRFIFLNFLFIVLSFPAHADSVSAKDGQVVYKLGSETYIVCTDGQLNENTYANLLGHYMKRTIERDLVERTLKS